jgi:hypothetical protein
MYAAPFFVTLICNLYGAICDLQQNAMQNAPKCSAICTKTQCEMHQNAGRFAPKRRTRWGKWRAHVYIYALELERFSMMFD